MVTSLYIHIPFCREKCFYCDFYSQVYRPRIAADYAQALADQLKKLPGKFNTVFIGGGTPTVLDRKSWQKILKALRPMIEERAEFTVEANPESLTADKIKLFRDNGVNRLSIGLQSLNDDKLRSLGRLHDAAGGRMAVVLAHKLGFKNISVDLIFGAPGETFRDWQKDLRQACALPIKHLSAYGLSYEKGTPLSQRAKQGLVVPAAEPESVKMYRYNLDYLPQRGFKHYEISNFAEPGFACRHNLVYWRNQGYFGLGPSAVSYVDGVRSRNVDSVVEYLQRINEKNSPVVFKEKLPRLRRAKETAALAIRTAEGIDFDWFKRTTGFDFPDLENDAIKICLAKKMVQYLPGKRGIALTKKGFLFADTVAMELL